MALSDAPARGDAIRDLLKHASLAAWISLSDSGAAKAGTHTETKIAESPLGVPALLRGDERRAQNPSTSLSASATRATSSSAIPG